jgi:hypothetical protein
MKKQAFPKEFIELLHSITNKRARVVIDHILKKGFITTADLEKKYGYNHPPRAARDVREAGIPLETFRVKDKTGRSIAAYKFGDLKKIQKGKLSGRTVFSKEFKESLYKLYNGKCFICSGYFELRYLQIDHRVPYELSGDDSSISQNLDDFMLLCGSCNRAKSWSCEHCVNWKEEKDSAICKQCYWGNPENYLHIALKSIRRLDIHWEEHEIKSYEKIKTLANREKTPLPDFVKKVLDKNIMG